MNVGIGSVKKKPTKSNLTKNVSLFLSPCTETSKRRFALDSFLKNRSTLCVSRHMCCVLIYGAEKYSPSNRQSGRLTGSGTNGIHSMITDFSGNTDQRILCRKLLHIHVFPRSLTVKLLCVAEYSQNGYTKESKKARVVLWKVWFPLSWRAGGATWCQK